MEKLVPPIAVEVIGEHELRVTFKDGLVGDIDFAGRHWRHVSAPLTALPRRRGLKREAAHALIDRYPDEALDEVATFLECRRARLTKPSPMPGGRRGAAARGLPSA